MVADSQAVASAEVPSEEVVQEVAGSLRNHFKLIRSYPRVCRDYLLIFTRINLNFTMNFTGLLVGLSTFLIIGLFHPLVIKAEYYLGVKSWIIFAIAGLLFGIASIMVSHLIWSTILGVVAFSSFWSILEVIHQRERVRKGWFPEGPGHKK